MEKTCLISKNLNARKRFSGTETSKDLLLLDPDFGFAVLDVPDLKLLPCAGSAWGDVPRAAGGERRARHSPRIDEVGTLGTKS